MQCSHKTLLGFPVILLLAAGCAGGPQSRPLAWEQLPTPKNASSTRLEGEQLLLEGQPIRTMQMYSAPLAVECDVMVEDGSTNGMLYVFLTPTNSVPDDIFPPDYLAVGFAYHPPEIGHVQVLLKHNSTSTTVGGQDFVLQSKVAVHLKIEIMNDHLVVHMNDQSFLLKDTRVPYERFQIQLSNALWHNRWRVRNFVVR